MAKEIERKYLVEVGDFAPARTRIIESAYLSVGDPEIRIARYRGVYDSYQITVKQGTGLIREEIVVNVPDSDGTVLYNMTPPQSRIAKIRDEYVVGGVIRLKWEIDTYLGRHAGLRVAELEIPYPEYEPTFPEFLSPLYEVTEEDRFKNRRLATMSDEEFRALLKGYYR